MTILNFRHLEPIFFPLIKLWKNLAFLYASFKSIISCFLLAKTLFQMKVFGVFSLSPLYNHPILLKNDPIDLSNPNSQSVLVRWIFFQSLRKDYHVNAFFPPLWSLQDLSKILKIWVVFEMCMLYSHTLAIMEHDLSHLLLNVPPLHVRIDFRIQSLSKFYLVLRNAVALSFHHVMDYP